MKLKALCLILAIAMLFVMAGCTKAPEDTTPSDTTPTTEDTTPVDTNNQTDAPGISPVSYFTISYGTTFENVKATNVYPNEDGTVHVDFAGDVRKVADLSEEVLTSLAYAVENAKLKDLSGKDAYEDGEASASLYVEYADGTVLTVGFTGQIPDEFLDGYTALQTYFTNLLADVEEYVPTPTVQGEVDETLLNEMLQIMTGSGIQGLDTYYITTIARDDYFGYTAGLANTDAVSNAVTCAPMMMTTAYSLVVVTLEEGADAAAVAQDFADNIDWRKWVCVNPSNALIAEKNGMVLCMVADASLYTGTAAGIDAAGWTVVNTLENPDL